MYAVTDVVVNEFSKDFAGRSKYEDMPYFGGLNQMTISKADSFLK
jgi:hypothetical protein